MKWAVCLVSALVLSWNAHSQELVNPNEAFIHHAQQIDAKLFEELPVIDRGRIKPFHTLARESVLFLVGSYKFEGLNAIQTYLGLIGFSEIEKLKILNIRSAPVRKALGFSSDERFVSIGQLEKSKLLELAQPLLEKEERSPREVEPNEKHLIEIHSQYWLLKQVQAGQHFLGAVAVPGTKDSPAHGGEAGLGAVAALREVLQDVIDEKWTGMDVRVESLNRLIREQKWPEVFVQQFDHVSNEVAYNRYRPFFIAAIFFLLIGIGFCLKQSVPFMRAVNFNYLIPIPFVPLFIGLFMRISITGFAPVTNMYGTMIWVAFGIGLFSSILWMLYKTDYLVGGLWVAASAFLFLNESIPLILSPDLDPIVAVLHSNLWLTIHVLTIVISYAALAISAVLGNIVLIRSISNGVYDDQYVKDAARSCYRMIQLGVFLLSVGIILGGIWADYSWGRFWGWDPKETWALVADLGFLAILHARFVGWLSPFTLLAASTVGFLLVIMAWYGVNFVLAAGLHSYGFSSGGATLVLVFVIVQLLVLFAATGLYYRKMKDA